MPKRIKERVLLVEGQDDQRIIPFIVEANGVDWGNRGDEIVDIQPLGGIAEMTKPGTISAKLKARGLQSLGIIVDANDSADQRYQALRNACLGSFPNIPKTLAKNGLVHERDDGLRIGIWLMPDNNSRGMMETFLSFLIDDVENDDLWQHALDSCSNAKSLGAPFKDVHSDKAHIHTWLAWQEEPGRQLHDAVKFRFLDPTNEKAQQFVQWFRELYQL